MQRFWRQREPSPQPSIKCAVLCKTSCAACGSAQGASRKTAGWWWRLLAATLWRAVWVARAARARGRRAHLVRITKRAASERGLNACCLLVPRRKCRRTPVHTHLREGAEGAWAGESVIGRVGGGGTRPAAAVLMGEILEMAEDRNAAQNAVFRTLPQHCRW